MKFRKRPGSAAHEETETREETMRRKVVGRRGGGVLFAAAVAVVLVIVMFDFQGDDSLRSSAGEQGAVGGGDEDAAPPLREVSGPPELTLEVVGGRTEANVGPYCWEGTCVDGFFPDPSSDDLAVLEVSGGETMKLMFEVAPQTVEVTLRPVGAAESGRSLRAHGDDWRIRLPDIGAAQRIEIFSRWGERGDALYAARLDPTSA